MLKKLKIKSGLLAFLLTAAALLISFASGDMYPFGWGCLSWCDMNQQLIPLFCDFKDILSGEKSLFLNLSNAGGMNFYGVFFFFLSSPFSFSVAFVEKADIPFLMNILVILKLSLAAFTGGFVLERLYKNLHFTAVSALATAYALCGYGMLFYQNIMWLDMMYLFPLVVLGVKKLIKDNRSALLTITLAFSVIFNFYISFTVFLFVILFFGVFALMYPKADRKIYINLGLSGVVSLLCSAFVWLPCLLQYLSSARSGGFIDGLKNADFFAPYDTTLTVLLCSGILLGGIILFIPRFSTAKKEHKLLFFMLLLTAAPLIIEPFNLMWHLGSYMSFPARYGFIPVFLGLTLAGAVIEKRDNTKANLFGTAIITIRERRKRCYSHLFLHKIFDFAANLKKFAPIRCNECVRKLKNNFRISRQNGFAKHFCVFRLSHIIIMLSVFAFCVFGLAVTEKNLDRLSAYVNSLWGNRDALKGQIFLCGIFALASIITFTGLKKCRLKQWTAGLLLCVIVFAQGLCSTEIFILTAKDSLSIYNYQSVISLKEAADKDGFYRVNTKNKITDANMTGAAGFNSLGHYTSLNDKNYMEATKLFGYSGYWMEIGNWDGSILSDALLSVGYTAQRVNGEYSLKENPYYMGLGIMAEGETPEILGTKDRLYSLGEATAEMLNTKNPVKKYEFLGSDYCTITETISGYTISTNGDNCRIKYTLTFSDPEALYFDAYNGFSNKLNEPINGSFAILINGEMLNEYYPSQKQNGVLCLGSFKNETVDITIEISQDCQLSSFGIFGIEENTLADIAKNTHTLKLDSKGGKISGTADKGEYFISLPFMNNYKITLNDEKVSYNKALNGFISISLPQSGELEISFTPKGFYMGIAVSVVGLTVLILMLLFRKNKLNFSTVTENIFYGAFLGVFGAAALWVYIIPLIVNLKDFKY